MTPMHKQVDVIEIRGFAFYLLSNKVADNNAKKSSSYGRTVVAIVNNCCTLCLHSSQNRHLSVMQMQDSMSPDLSSRSLAQTWQSSSCCNRIS